MRIAVLSDIHANRPALQAVLDAVDAAAPEQVVVAGDIVNRGPEPADCLEAILDRRDRLGWHVLKGNHEDFVIWEVDASPDRQDWERKLYAHTHWTMERVRSHLPALKELVDHITLRGPDGSELRFVHASMRSNRHGMYEHMDDDDISELISPAPAVLTVGHTHIPFVRTVGSTLVVNAGATGLPFDGDPRPSFAVLDWKQGQWSARIVRVSYDRAEGERRFESTGYRTEGGPMVRLILDELRNARPRLGTWHRRYERHVAEGRMTIEESVDRLLADVASSPTAR